MDLTVVEVIALQREMEHTIADAIREFQLKAGMRVHAIDIIQQNVVSSRMPISTIIRADVRL